MRIQTPSNLQDASPYLSARNRTRLIQKSFKVSLIISGIHLIVGIVFASSWIIMCSVCTAAIMSFAVFAKKPKYNMMFFHVLMVYGGLICLLTPTYQVNSLNTPGGFLLLFVVANFIVKEQQTSRNYCIYFSVLSIFYFLLVYRANDFQPIDQLITDILFFLVYMGVVYFIDTHIRRSALTLSKQVEESSEYLSLIIDRNPNFIFAMDTQKRFTIVNQKVQDLIKIPGAKMLGKSPEDLGLDKVPPFSKCSFGEDIFESEVPFLEDRFSYTTPTGEKIWLQSVKTVFFNEYKQEKEVLYVCTDISHIVQKEEEKERLLEIIENTSDLVSMGRARSNAFYLNQAGREMMGWTQDENIERKNIFDFLGEIEGKRILEQGFPTVHAKGIWRSDPVYFQGKDGQPIPASTIFMGHKDKSDGKVKYYSIIARDMTDQLAAKEEMQHLNEVIQGNLLFLQTLINTIPNPIFYKNQQGTFIGCNTSFAAIFGKTEQEIIGKSSFDLFDADFAAKIQTQDQLYMDEKGGGSFETKIKFVDGSLHDMRVYKQRFHHKDHAVGGLVGIMEDVTEINEKNRALKNYIESNMQLENFAHIASHDLKEPIRTIISLSQLLERRIRDRLRPSEREFLHLIIDATLRMDQLIRDLLSYSRVDTHSDFFEAVDLNLTLKAVIQDLRKVILEQDALVDIQNLPFVEADGTQMRQLFQNLLSNALKFQNRDSKPHISVQCQPNGRNYIFSVADNGIGIHQDFYERIFLLFKKLHHHKSYQGSGIGLALCKKIVEKHRGDIWLKSTPGKGTTFYFTIPKKRQVLVEPTR